MARTKRQPLLSVIVPVYRDPETVRRSLPTLACLLRDAVGSFEIVCADDGSTDGTREALQSLARRERAIRVIPLDVHRGQHFALLKGIEAAAGTYLATTDVDLEASPEWIIRGLELVQRGFALVNGARDYRRRPVWERWALRLPIEAARFALGIELSDLSSPYKMFNREVADRVLALRPGSHFLALHAAYWGRPFREIPVRGRADFHRPSRYRFRDRVDLYGVFWRDLWGLMREHGIHRQDGRDGSCYAAKRSFAEWQARPSKSTPPRRDSNCDRAQHT